MYHSAAPPRRTPVPVYRYTRPPPTRVVVHHPTSPYQAPRAQYVQPVLAGARSTSYLHSAAQHRTSYPVYRRWAKNLIIYSLSQ